MYDHYRRVTASESFAEFATAGGMTAEKRKKQNNFHEPFASPEAVSVYVSMFRAIGQSSSDDRTRGTTGRLILVRYEKTNDDDPTFYRYLEGLEETQRSLHKISCTPEVCDLSVARELAPVQCG